MAEPPDSAAVAGMYSKETERLTSSARWIAAGLAGLGAVLVAGMDLTKFGTTWSGGGPRAIVALISILVGVAAYAWMIAVTSTVFTSGALSLEALSANRFQDAMPDRIRRTGWREPLARSAHYLRSETRRRQIAERRTVSADIERESSALYGDVAESLPDLHRLLHQASEEHRQALAEHRPPGEELTHRLTTLRNAGAVIVDYANYALAVVRLRRAKRHLLLGSIITVAAVTVFAIAVYG